MKKYIKPQITDLMLQSNGIIPLAAIGAAVGAAASTAASVASVGAAMAGGYMIGRAVKSMKVRVDDLDVNYLERVITNE